MKLLYKLVTLCLLLVGKQAMANEVLVKGYIKYANGSPAVNQKVFVSVDTSTSNITCKDSKEVFTDQNGYYKAYLSCTTPIVRVIISTKDCNGNLVVERPQVSPPGVVERNFTLCNPVLQNCLATFKFENNNLNRFTFHFNSSLSHGATATDNIVKRRWRFGDGSILEGNEVSPIHTFPGKGIYEVCLTIVTAAGCEKTVCQKVVIEEASNNCVAIFKFEKTISNHLAFHFNSSSSTGTTPNDVIVKRRWRFGDGSILEGNEISPAHTYAAKGTYEVCLTIVTAAGCEKTTCQRIVIEDNPTNCIAYFLIQPSSSNRLNFKFIDSSHGISATDQIVKRKWRFGDGIVLEGNIVNPEHAYPGKGIYEVCLTIFTASGCEKTLCKKIVIEELSNTSCKPEFVFTISPNNTNEVKFNSNNSSAAPGDNIISRKWHFGDGKEATTIDPVHLYEKNGTYNVCLVIKTANGCTKEICKLVVVNTRKCAARFVFELIPPAAGTLGYSVRFNSNNSTSNDTIVSRTWSFGDGTSATTIDPKHTYTHPGLYTVCLTIKTRNGCESKECRQILVGPNAPACAPHFTFERLSPKKIKFNSAMSWAAVGDSIVQRSWDFGDGSAATTGNDVSVSKEYTRAGVYTVCLKIKTAKGCENKVCNVVRIEEPTVSNPTTAPIKIVSLYPSPVHERMTTDVWSLHGDIKATIAIYDIYGMKKWEGQKVLSQGNNITVVATGFLMPGPYFFKVTTMYGVQSRSFFKL